MTWTPHDTALVAWAVASIAVVVVLITVFRFHAFVALVIGSGFVGLGSGLKATDVIAQFQNGFGATLGGVGIISGPLFGAWVGARVVPTPPQALVDDLARARSGGGATPAFGSTVATILLPVVLMLGRSIADLALAKGTSARTWIDFLGDPLVALLASVLVAMFTFGYGRGFTRRQVESMLAGSLGPIAGIVMIIGAGGGFKQTLVAAGIGSAIGKAAASSAVSPLLLGWLIAVGIRLATGSATVATVTASGLMAPILGSLPPGAASKPLVVLAIGAGSVFLSHVNDAGFWLVKEYFGMTVGETFKTWSAMETILSVTGLVLVLLAGLFVH